MAEESDYYQHQKKIARIASTLSNHARKGMFDSFMRAFSPTSHSRVLDVGVTCDRRSDCNFFEKFYPHPDKITAVGLENASFLEEEFPGLKYLQADALDLPFKDNEFDLAVSWAVIEHIGSRERQKRFVHELTRVSKHTFITTPNRWYPVEFHTVMPFLHWLPPEQFRSILKTLNMPFFASEDTLNLLDEKELLALLPESSKVRTCHFRLFGPISNLAIAVDN